MAGGGKRAVVLLNLGGPSREEDIRPFLFSFFRDENVITVPNPLRFLIALWISLARSKGAAKEAYAPLGGKSPLLENTQAQARALEAELQKENPQSRVFIAMRHWHPRSFATARAVASFRPDEIVLLPLYPQYSTTTTLSALQDWRRAAAAAGLEDVETKTVCCYPDDAGFVAASAELILETLGKATGKKMRLLFSAHGLPEKIVKSGDPYQKQVERTAAAIVRKIGIPALDWQVCYQSRVGRLKWIGPSIGETLQKAAADGAGVAVYPLAFVSEHVETLVELDIEYRRRAAELGLDTYLRVPAAGTHPRFIAGLKGLVSAGGTPSPCAERCHCKEKDA
ncbi:MAG: ferrochelatase [Alphaproteobacteria bacterium]|nr:ferrochelatase [Alphaproteobacteria bacterium]MDE2335969.1 ferrochelatase [Alphaproteobacteria bacterium]